MSDLIFQYLFYIGQLLLLTLGTIVICGLAVHLCAVLFARLSGSGSGAVFDVTSIIGTPVHELGHAAMCILFGHRITGMRLWNPHPDDGLYGYVEHSYNRRNPWASLGNLFIAVGPIFSGIGVMILMLWLCFPTQWSAYLDFSRSFAATGTTPAQLIPGVLSLLSSMFTGFGEDWIRSLLGIVVILTVSLHVSLSWLDIRSALGAIPIYLVMVTLFAIVTGVFGLAPYITSTLWLLNLRTLSLFSIVIAFSAVWVLIALIIRGVKALIGCF